jgi:hypothetical protein
MFTTQCPMFNFQLCLACGPLSLIVEHWIVNISILLPVNQVFIASLGGPTDH